MKHLFKVSEEEKHKLRERFGTKPISLTQMLDEFKDEMQNVREILEKYKTKRVIKSVNNKCQ